jgi:hypothetical protein
MVSMSYSSRYVTTSAGANEYMLETSVAVLSHPTMSRIVSDLNPGRLHQQRTYSCMNLCMNWSPKLKGNELERWSTCEQK